MIYRVAPDWSSAEMQCMDCGGTKVGAELSSEEAAKLRNPLQFRLRRTLRNQLAAQLHRMGCPHVT
jgi:hypothetical protein